MTTYGPDRPEPGHRPGDGPDDGHGHGPVYPGMAVPPSGEVAPAAPTVRQPPAQSRLPVYLAVVVGIAALCCIGGIAVVSVSLTGGEPGNGHGSESGGEPGSESGGEPGSGHGGEPGGPAAGPEPAGPSAPPGQHRLGVPARDGQLEFTVDRVECGRERVEEGRLIQTAEGQYCLARMTVANVGDQPQAFSGAVQSALGEDGSRYRPDRTAALILNPEFDLYPHELTPGDRIDAVLAFDLPPDGDIAQLLLHEGRDSPGVVVVVA